MSEPEQRERVILVDEQNRATGTADKLVAHKNGLLHRAFSIFLIDADGRILLQRRHPWKYHSGGLWANTCCGHPRPGETTIKAAHRRMFEELSLRADLRLAFQARYRGNVSRDMTENELVQVYFGGAKGEPEPDPTEIDGLMMLSFAELEEHAIQSPESLTVWMHHYLWNHAQDIEFAIRNYHSAEG